MLNMEQLSLVEFVLTKPLVIKERERVEKKKELLFEGEKMWKQVDHHFIYRDKTEQDVKVL